MITGESIPVEKTIGHRDTGGTINQTGSILMGAEKVGAEIALSRVVGDGGRSATKRRAHPGPTFPAGSCPQ